MKTLRKIMHCIVLIAFIGLNINSVIAEGETISVTEVEVKDTKNISATLDHPIDTDSLTSEELKIMHDIPVETAELDIADAKKATITLEAALTENTVYNFISITGVDGSMDFETSNNLDGEELLNTADEGIQSILILNPKVLEVVYYDAIAENEIEVKLLKDLQIESIESESDVKFNVKTAGKLQTNSNYIFMLLAAKTVNSEEAEIESGIYDFDTEDELSEPAPEIVLPEPDSEDGEIKMDLNAAPETEDNSQSMAEESQNSIIEGETTEIETGESTETDLNAAAESNIEEVAEEVTEVPTTGTATNIVLILTLLSAMGIQFRRKK